MPEPIRLTCVELPDDVLDVSTEEALFLRRRDPLAGTTVVYLKITEAGQETRAVSLDEARARALFNWLGVWLHTDGAS